MQVTALSKQNEFLKGYIVRLQRQLEVSVIVIIGVGVGVGVGVGIFASSVQFSSCIDLLRALVVTTFKLTPSLRLLSGLSGLLLATALLDFRARGRATRSMGGRHDITVPAFRSI